jgi:hypothetical protein
MVCGAYKMKTNMAVLPVHLLAKATLQTSTEEIWMEEYHEFFRDGVIKIKTEITLFLFC